MIMLIVYSCCKGMHWWCC